MNNDLQLIIKTPDNAFLKAVEFNFEELSTALENSLLKYQGLVYEAIKEAKGDRATLNKLIKAFEDEKKRVKKMCLAPADTFCDKVDILIGKVKSVHCVIDEKVKADEETKKTAKLEEIKKTFAEIVGDLAVILKFDDVFNEKWLNTTVSLNVAKTEMDAKIQSVKTDLETLDGLNTEFASQVKHLYLRTFDLGQALREKTRLEEEKARLEAYEFKKKEQAQEQKKEPITATIEAPKTEHANDDGGVLEIKTTPEQLKLYELSFKVMATGKQLQALKEFLTTNNINYERI